MPKLIRRKRAMPKSALGSQSEAGSRSISVCSDRSVKSDSKLSLEQLSQEIISGRKQLFIAVWRCDDMVGVVGKPAKRRRVNDKDDRVTGDNVENRVVVEERSGASTSTTAIRENPPRTDVVTNIISEQCQGSIPVSPRECTKRKIALEFRKKNAAAQTTGPVYDIRKIIEARAADKADPDYAWHCCVLWDTTIQEKLELHAGSKWKNSKFTQLTIADFLSECVADDNPDMDIWDEPYYKLLKVFEDGFQDVDGYFVVPVVEVTTEKNCHVPEETRIWNLYLTNTVDNWSLLTEFTRRGQIQTLVMIWGFCCFQSAQQLPWNSELPARPPAIGNIIINHARIQKKPPQILIFHGESPSEERRHSILTKFSDSELNHFNIGGVERYIRRKNFAKDSFMMAVHFSRPFFKESSKNSVQNKMLEGAANSASRGSPIVITIDEDEERNTCIPGPSSRIRRNKERISQPMNSSGNQYDKLKPTNQEKVAEQGNNVEVAVDANDNDLLQPMSQTQFNMLFTQNLDDSAPIEEDEGDRELFDSNVCSENPEQYRFTQDIQML